MSSLHSNLEYKTNIYVLLSSGHQKNAQNNATVQWTEPQCWVCSKCKKGIIWIIIEVHRRNTTRENVNHSNSYDLAIKNIVLMKWPITLSKITVFIVIWLQSHYAHREIHHLDIVSELQKHVIHYKSQNAPISEYEQLHGTRSDAEKVHEIAKRKLAHRVAWWCSG